MCAQTRYSCAKDFQLFKEYCDPTGRFTIADIKTHDEILTLTLTIIQRY